MDGRIKVIIASLLKPVDEPRMYHKLGRSLAQTYKYEVNIVGFVSKNLHPDPLIRFWPLFNFERISLGRLLAPLRFFKKLVQLKPELIILTSPDFLLVASAYKILFGCQLIYDLQENHYRNIIWSHSKPSLLRRLRAFLVRMKESLTDRMIIQYILAEQCYVTECSFISQPALVLENKALKPPLPLIIKKNNLSKASAAQLRFLYSGTVAASYGIFDTLPLMDAVAEIHPHLTYTICGHCPSKSVYQRLKAAVKSRPWIRLQISAQPLPHALLLKELQQADFTLIAYQLNPSSKDCFPTRIWEALAWQVPMIFKKEHPWFAATKAYQAGFAVDFTDPDKESLLYHLFDQAYYQQQLPSSIYWESQEQSLRNTLDEIFP